MSKQIKQMQMDVLKKTFEGVRDLVVLNISGIDCHADGVLRRNLRKKNIHLQIVKNSLTRRVFDDMGFKLKADSPYWQGNTALAWGADSVATLSREIDGQVRDLEKKNAKLKDRIKFKGAIIEGEAITFDQAKKMPTRMEAIGQIIAMILAPGSAIAGQLVGPASQVASQIQTLSEKKEEKSEEAAAAEPAPPAG